MTVHGESTWTESSVQSAPTLYRVRTNGLVVRGDSDERT